MAFSGFNWHGLSPCDDHPMTEKNRTFLDKINWDALCQRATRIRDGKHCTVDEKFTSGGRHMVRILNFEDGTRWIARLRKTSETEDARKSLFQREVDCMILVRERTSVPVPKIYGYDSSSTNDVGAPFMLIDCLNGNCAVDMTESHDIPPEQKSKFHTQMAKFQTEIASITFPKIGSIIRLQDGSYDIGPLPKLGGPFNTATEYLNAWAENTKFWNSEEEIKVSIYKGSADPNEIAASILEFPSRLKELASTIPTRNSGPFPLLHPDFGHQNIVVDNDYTVLGVIDWEHTCTVPWETIYFPLTLCFVPAPMEPPFLYDENGVPEDEAYRVRLIERAEYVAMIREVEKQKGWEPTLSMVMGDAAGQDLAGAIQLFAVEGKYGYYCKVLDVHHERWTQKKTDMGIIDGVN